MLKISQNTFLRSLSISCLCLSLSSSYSFAMDHEDKEGKPTPAPVTTFFAPVKGDTSVKEADAAVKEILPLSRNFFPLSDDDRRASQALLEKLKTFDVPADQKETFDTINAARVSMTALFEQLDSLRNPSSSSGAQSSPSAPVPDSCVQDEKDTSSIPSTNLLLSSNPKILSMARHINTDLHGIIYPK